MKLLYGACCTLLLAAIAPAQPPMPQPGPELKQVDYFAGSWSMNGELKAGPMGPGGGKMTMHEHCQWQNGGFFMLCHSDYSGSMGNGVALSVMGYNSADKVYTYDEYNSVGEADHSTGSFQGDTWTWNGEEKMGGQVIKGRFTMKILSPTSYSFKYEMSTDGTNWATAMEGNATKGK